MKPVHPLSLLATWFGCGLAPKAPGTVGTLGALPVAWVLLHLGGHMTLLIALGLVLGFGTWAAHRYGQHSGTADDKRIVVDEVAGMWLVLLVAPATPLAWVFAFALFRLFDIVKPWPISWCDRTFKNGFGVMLDDMMAAIWAAAIIWVINRYLAGQIPALQPLWLG